MASQHGAAAVSTRPDPSQVDEFSGKMLGILNGAALALMTSIGHQTGLFDVLAKLPPRTSEEIARSAGLVERYVREWLAAMVVGGIVRHDPAAGTFHLPPEHAACLTRDAGPNNMATYMQYIALLAEVEGKIVNCFRHGGGVPYAAYPRFQRLMAEDSEQTLNATLIDVTLPLVPNLVARLEAGIDVLDVGCGRGSALNLMARSFPKSRYLGIDISEEGIAAGRKEAALRGNSNVRLEVKDAALLDARNQYDLVTTFDAIHDQAHPRKVLRAIREALRPGGIYLMVDIAASSHLAENLEHPLAPFLYTTSTMHCMTVSLAEGGEGLGTCWGEQQARDLLAEAGFSQVAVKRVEGDIFNNFYIATKD